MALLSERNDFFSSLISPKRSSMRSSFRASTFADSATGAGAGATATAAREPVLKPDTRVSREDLGKDAVAGFAPRSPSSSAAVISHFGRLNSRYGGLVLTDLV